MTNMRSGYRSLSLKALKVLKLYSGEVAHRSYFQVIYHLLFFSGMRALWMSRMEG